MAHLRFDRTRLKTLREAFGDNLGEFAKRVGAEKQQVWAWENGEYEPNLSSLLRIVNATGVRLDTFFLRESETDKSGVA